MNNVYSDLKLETECQKEVMDAFHGAEKKKRAKPQEMFDDIYDEMPLHLKNQRNEMIAHVKQYKNEYPLELYEKL